MTIIIPAGFDDPRADGPPPARSMRIALACVTCGQALHPATFDVTEFEFLSFVRTGAPPKSWNGCKCLGGRPMSGAGLAFVSVATDEPPAAPADGD